MTFPAQGPRISHYLSLFNCSRPSQTRRRPRKCCLVVKLVHASHFLIQDTISYEIKFEALQSTFPICQTLMDWGWGSQEHIAESKGNRPTHIFRMLGRQGRVLNVLYSYRLSTYCSKIPTIVPPTANIKLSSVYFTDIGKKVCPRLLHE